MPTVDDSNPADVEVIRVYEDRGRRGREHRVLVDRLWPRGVKKTDLDIDLWEKEVAPSTELRHWYDHDPRRFDEFARRYRAELERDPGASAVERLRRVLHRRVRVVLLTATRDVEHSGAIVLRDVITSEGSSSVAGEELRP
jgi:uncharacterized protein YeaO (DUF488 family)